MKYQNPLILGSSVVALFAAGCGPAMPEDLIGGGGSGSGEPVESVSQALTQCKYENLSFYTFDTPLRQRVGSGTPTNTLCWLTNIAGSALNYKPDMSVTSDANGWYVTGTLNSAVKVACAPLNCFYANQIAQEVTWASETYSVTGADATGGMPFSGFGACASRTTNGWMSDSAIIFQGIEQVSASNSGLFATTKDVAITTQPSNSTSTTSVTYKDCYDDGASRKAFASSLFVGVPGGVHRPVFMGPNASHSYFITGAGEYVAKSWDPSRHMEMRNVDDGICYLASVSGGLKTESDSAEIYPVFKQAESKWRWVLHVQKLSGSNNSTYGITAKARCYKYKQAQF